MPAQGPHRLEDAMRRLLTRLELTTNGATSTWDASGGAEPDYIPRLGHSDAPHLHYLELWNAATTDAARQRVYEAAQDELDAILHSRGDSTREESKQSLHARIVREGKGWPAVRVAIHCRCGVTVVHSARHAAGVDLEFGEEPRAAPAPAGAAGSAARREQLEQLIAGGRSLRQAAEHLGISYWTARRDVGQMD